jgi:nucleoside-diphosphate-sugar epimerase
LGSLVTGIGYIGSRLAGMLLDAGEAVTGIDNLFSTDPAAVQRLAARDGFTFVEGDVADEAAVRRAFQAGAPIHTVYHLAAQSSGHPEAAPVQYTESSNLVGPRVLLEQSCGSGVSTFVFGSSLQVYGRRPAGYVHEGTPYGPILDIAHLSKVYVEKLMEMFSHTRGLRCVAARIGLVYGLSPVMKTDPRFMTAPNKFCLQVARGERLRVDASGLAPTSLISVDDAARGLMSLGRWERGRYSAINLIGETATIADVARLVGELAARRGLQANVAQPAERPTIPECSFHSVLAGIGWRPSVGLEEGLAPVLEHFLASAGSSAAGAREPEGAR